MTRTSSSPATTPIACPAKDHQEARTPRSEIPNPFGLRLSRSWLLMLLFFAAAFLAFTAQGLGTTVPPVRGNTAAPTVLASSWVDDYGKGLVWFAAGAITLAMVLGAWNRLIGKPERREVTATTTPAPEFVARRDFDDLKDEVATVRSDVRRIELRVEKSKTEILAAGEERAVALHLRCNKHDELIGGVSEKVDFVADLVKQQLAGGRKA